MKKLLVLLLALMLLAVCGVCLAEDEVLVENDYSYIVLEDGTVRIYQYDTFNDKETVKIPAKLGGKQVTELGDWSFSGCTAVKVVIPEGVKTIGEGAFSRVMSEEWITDEECLNTKGKLRRIPGKYRIKTIDLVDELKK
ncbi:MAG: hypothetical protein MJ136_06290, partial [Clostridia bacterium]|nr:hypothetical protein [Clostridia bacterium]